MQLFLCNMELSSISQLPLLMPAFLPSPIWTLLLLLACHWPHSKCNSHIVPGPHFCNAPFFFFFCSLTAPPPPLPHPRQHPYLTQTLTLLPPPKTAASRYWTGPPHLPGEVHPQCGKSFGAGAVHITNHTGCLTFSGFCNSNHITLCSDLS